MTDQEENVFLRSQWISSGSFSSDHFDKILANFNPAYNINENILHLHATNGLHDKKGKKVSDELKAIQYFFEREKERVGVSQVHQYFGAGF